MDRIKITLIFALTCIIVIGTTCLAVTGVVNAQRGLVLREEASTSATPLTTVPDDEEVEIIENLGEWYKVKYGLYEGYLYAEYVDAEEVTQPETQEQPEETPATQEETVATPESIYPQNVTTKTEIKAYIIPSFTSRVVTIIQAEKSITINYALNKGYNISYEGKEYWVRKYSIDGKPADENIINNNENKTEEPAETTQTETTQTETTFIAIDNKKGYIDVNSAANVREKADASATVITTLLRNTGVTIIGEEGDFYKIQFDNITGYVAKSLVSDSPVETTSRGGVGTRETAIVEEQNENNSNTASSQAITGSSQGERIANFAKQYEGYKYVYGGTTPSGFDCTGFAYYVYNSCGIPLSRSCSVQAQTGVEVGRQSRDELQAGDLLLFANGTNGSIGHVGIYIGNGYFIHAKNSNSGVVIDHLTNNPYYNQYYYSGRRIVN